jgi:hypothetical protein
MQDSVTAGNDFSLARRSFGEGGNDENSRKASLTQRNSNKDGQDKKKEIKS